LTISLYDASVGSYLQTLDAVAGYLAKALNHFREAGIDPDEVAEARLIEDMRPFRFQVQHTAFHSAGAVEAILNGALHLPGPRPDHDYAGLQGVIDEARAKLRAVTRAEIDARVDEDVVFEARGLTRVFSAPGFLLSFSLPNFYFHATTAYDILRSKGAPIGKLDYMGKLRLKG
jgi:hypothetical protein